MKLGRLTKKIIYSSWFLAAIPAIIVMFFLPHLTSRNKIIIEDMGSNGGQALYDDLNSDSVPELIDAGKGTPYYYIIVMDANAKVYDQWNLMDIIDSNMASVFTGDYDGDGYKEIYVFTHKEDSLFLNIDEFLDPSGTKLERLFITKIGYLKGEVTSTIWPAGFFDVNSDGRKELYFSITTGFGLVPRRLFSFDLVNHTLKGSPLSGVISQFPKMVDVDNDNRPEIFGLIGASGNYKTPVPYSDWSSWLMVFNEKLEFKFEPVEFPGYPKTLDINAYKSESVAGYILSEMVTSVDPAVPQSRIMIYSSDGKPVRSRKYSELGIKKYARMFVVRSGNYDKIYVLEDKIYEVNDKLEIIRSDELPYKTQYYAFKADLNGDGKLEFILSFKEAEKIVVYNSDFHELAETAFKSPGDIWHFSSFTSHGSDPAVYLNAASHGYVIRMQKNKLYYPGFLIFPGTYLGFFILIALTIKITTYQVKEKENMKQRLIALQLQGIKSQLDPHFTFNTLNSVASLIYHEDRQAAYDYMNKFTMLLRGMLNDAERIYRTLGEELDFVETYLDLEKLRFAGKFNYRIQVGDEVTRKEQVPKLVLQTFAENSVKHGIMPCPSGGSIVITAVREKSWLKLSIEDNGIGREKAAGQSSSTGKGLRITNEFYDILNQVNKRKISFNITDLSNENGKAVGTRVDIMVPVD
jgi:hypothetical protein